MEHDRYNDFNGLVSSAIKSMNKIKQKKMGEHELGSAHTACLLHIHARKDGVTQTELARLCEVDKAQISRVTSRLFERGFIEESPDSINNLYRKKYILSPKGKTVTDRIITSILEINRFVSKEIPPEDIAVFYRTFQTICDNLKKVEESL